MHIVLTRPIEDSNDLINRFQLLGHQVTHMPLLQIRKISHSKINFQDYKGIIFTSTNAIKFLNLKEISKNIFCFCVGDATEKKARENGFLNVISASGNVDALIELIIQSFEKNHGKLIYFSSEFISKDLDLILKSKGYLINRVINYTSIPANVIKDNLVEKIKNNHADAVFVYSEKSAITLLNLIKKYSLTDGFVNSNLMCISEKIARVLNNLKWKKIFIFNPGEEEFLLYRI